MNDGAWVATTQVLSALGQLLGVRLLTEILTPSEFGMLALWLGGIALVASGIANPTMQALLRFYPEYDQHNQAGLVRLVARHQLLKLCAYLSPLLLAIAIVAVSKDWVKWPIVCLFTLLAMIEMVRMQNIAVLNAIRAQRVFGLWLVLEAWLRPLMACAAVLLLGANASWVMAAFLVTSISIWLLMRRFVPKIPATINATTSLVISQRFWVYTLPILPLAIFGWVSGMADRYIVAGIMTASDVGLYAAIYGLASRPMLMLSGIVETTIRPVLQKAIIENQMTVAAVYLKKWIFLVLLGSVLVLTVAAFMHETIAGIFLGSEFRRVSKLLPWLVLGHVFLILYHVFARVLFATDNSGKAVLAEMIGAIVAIPLLLILIGSFGLVGAVVAVICGYMAQLMTAYMFSPKFDLLSISNGKKQI